MRRFFLLFTMAIMANFGVLVAQKTNDVEQQINDIKLNGDYIYAESTDADWNSALAKAKNMLANNIEEWFKRENPDSNIEGLLTKSQKHMLEIKARRGKYFRAFVYVQKNNILSYTGSDAVIMIPINSSDSASSAKPTTVISHDEKPDVIIEDDKKEVVRPAETSLKLSPREKELADFNKFNQIEDYIRSRYATNMLKGYGQNADIPESLECYLLVYNRSGDIIAHLHKVGGTYTDFVSGEVVPIRRYQDNEVIWLQFK